MALNNKKGSITDLPFLLAGILSVAVVALLVSLLVSEINDKVQDNTIFDTRAKAASSNMVNDIPQVMNGGIIFIFFALVLVSYVLASLVPVHPIFIVFYIFELLVMIWLGGAIANVFQDIVEHEAMSSVSAQFSLTTYFFRYFPFIVGVTGAGLAIVMYKTKENLLYG